MKLSLAFIFYATIYFAQTPANDPSWQLVFNDDFNGAILDQNIWLIRDYYDNGAPKSGVATKRSKNVRLANGSLIVETHYEPNFPCSPPYYPVGYFCNAPNYFITSGWVEPQNANFLYGFYEARIKLDYKATYHPAFWLLNYSGSQFYSEIDIFEMPMNSKVNSAVSEYPVSLNCNDIINPCPYSYNGTDIQITNNFMTSNTHWSGPCNPTELRCGAQQLKVTPINDFTQWHLYGFDWQPDKLIWYIDGVEVRRSYLNSNTPFDVPMRVIFSAGTDPETLYYQTIMIGNATTTIATNVPNASILAANYPAKMEVDYFNYYQLKGDCSGNITQCNYNFNSHTNTVKNNYQLDCNSIVPISNSYFLRANTSITLNNGFEAPIGSDFFADNADFCKKNTSYITGNCGFAFTPCDYDFSSYNNDVKKHIQISGQNCQAIVQPNNNVKLKAIDFINLKEGFSVPTGSEIEMKITNCTN